LLALGHADLFGEIEQAQLDLLQQLGHIHRQVGLDGDIPVALALVIGVDVDEQPAVDGVDQVALFQVAQFARELLVIIGHADLFDGNGVEILFQKGVLFHLLGELTGELGAQLAPRAFLVRLV